MDVGTWLHGLGLDQYEQSFRDNDIDAEVLPELTEVDLEKLGIASLGHRKKLLKALTALRADAAPPPIPPIAGKGPVEEQTPARPIGEAERRQLTVMFIDLVDSTALSRRLDPEDMRELLRTFQDTVAGGVARFEGHIAKFLGDGVLCYFGWPRAQEDAAERAVRAGLGLVAAMPHLTSPGGEPLACRVGIATGPVVVGELIGEGSAAEETVVGETPNLAARLQGLAEPSSVIVGEGTRRLLGELFAYAEFGPQTLKGFTDPVRAWRILGEGAAEGRFEALHATGLTPLVGREHELALLLDRWERAKEGEGQVVLLSGEAGIGKSRLVRSLRERLGGEPHIPISQYCSPHHQNTALYMVAGHLERAANLRREEPAQVRLDRLEALLAQATEDVAGSAPVLADLLGIPTEGRYPSLELSPQQRKERTFQVLLDQLAGLAARRPVLALYEDVHWADPTTLELLGRVVERVQRLPVLAVVTSRPGFGPPWAGHGHVTMLSLGRLGRRQGGVMVERLTGGKPLPEEVLEQVLARTDGVPLFVEELTKAVLESGLLREERDRYALPGPLPPLAIPSTLQDSLMARLDRLAPVKEVAQVAAVIGREFSRELLAAVAPSGDNELKDALGQLEAAGLVFRRGEGTRAGYAFKHALVRDAAYGSLLRSRRQQLHANIATVIEERFPELAAAEPELLARHCAGAGLAERAVAHWQRAAELAIQRSANLEAVAHCEEAEAQLRLLPSSPEQARIEFEVQHAKSVALRAGRGFAVPESERAVLRACELCEELGDRVRLVHALRALFGFYYVAGRWTDAARTALRVRAAAEGLEDRTALCAHWAVDGMIRLFLGEPAEAVPRFQEALRRYDKADRDAHIRLSGHEMAALIGYHLAIAEWLAGLPEQALRTSGEALAAARLGGRPFPLGQTLANSALLRLLSKDWEIAEALASEAREVSVRHGIPDYAAFGDMLAGTAIAARGDTKRGAALAREGMSGLNRTGWRCIIPLLLAQLVLALSASGDTEVALETAGEALRMVRANGELAWEAEVLRVMGTVKRAAGTADAGEVTAHLRAAVEVARRQGALAFELRAATSLCRLWAEDGERRKACDMLAPIYARFTEGFNTPDLREAEALLRALG